MDLTSLLLFATGAVAGGLALWWHGRTRIQQVRSEAAAESAALAERLQHRDIQLQGLHDELTRMRETHTQWLGRSEQEAERRVAAESRASFLERRVGELTGALEHRETRLAEQNAQLTELGASVSRLQARIEEQQRGFEQQKQLLAEAELKFVDTFKALSSDALRTNNASFLELAKSTLNTFQEQAKGDLEKRQLAVNELVAPIKESLERVGVQVQEMEKARTGAYASLTEQVRAMQEAQLHLQKETGNLVKALSKSGVRGRWGEIQLRRVVEMAGMVAYCDFQEQASMDTEGGRLRPDMLIRLPNEKSIIVDSKAPMQAFMESLEAADEGVRRECLQRHARQVRTHLGQLSSKEYAAHLPQSPEFVVLFLPGEMLFSTALEADPSLIEEGVQHNVILATPTTLIALLRAVAYGWRQEQVAENAQKISALGREMYQRISLLADHLNDIRKHLERTVRAYNKAAGSFESRFRISARRFHELGAAEPGQDIAHVPHIESTTREVAIPETTLLPDLEEPRLLTGDGGTVHAA